MELAEQLRHLQVTDTDEPRHYECKTNAAPLDLGKEHNQDLGHPLSLQIYDPLALYGSIERFTGKYVRLQLARMIDDDTHAMMYLQQEKRLSTLLYPFPSVILNLVLGYSADGYVLRLSSYIEDNYRVMLDRLFNVRILGNPAIPDRALSPYNIYVRASGKPWSRRVPLCNVSLLSDKVVVSPMRSEKIDIVYNNKWMGPKYWLEEVDAPFTPTPWSRMRWGDVKCIASGVISSSAFCSKNSSFCTKISGQKGGKVLTLSNGKSVTIELFRGVINADFDMNVPAFYFLSLTDCAHDGHLEILIDGNGLIRFVHLRRSTVCRHYVRMY